MALFQHEDFIILGMLFAKYFPAYIYDFGNGAWGGGSWIGGGGGWLPDGIQKYGTGRGGIITGAFDVDGDDGRPGASDNATGPVDPSLAGGKGTISGPGDGLYKGSFGFGGNANEGGFGMTRSSGGGSGWFGGGSSFIDAGGGGGSNFVYSDNELSETGIKAAGDDYKPPEWIKKALWIGIDSITFSHYIYNKALYDINTSYVTEYEKWRDELGSAYDDFIRYHQRANGNGLILISKPNKMIEYNKNDNLIQNIETVIEYTGRVVSWKPPQDGSYHFILWGAQGGTTFYTPAGMGGIEYQQYTGGFGGAVGCVLNLEVKHIENETEVETELFLYVGQKGLVATRNTRAWNGGGNLDGGCTGGGGATDIRFSGVDNSTNWQNNLFDRIAVAGGGGGCIGSGNGNEPPQEPIKGGSTGNVNGGGEQGEIPIPGEGEDIPYFLVNDKSLVYVTIQYFTQSQLPSNYDINCTIYINGGNEGILSQDFNIDTVNGVIELVYPLDQIYPPNTDTHWVTITANINTNIMFIIPDNGINIRVETRADVNEPNSNLDQNKKPVFLRILNKLILNDLYKINLILPPENIHTSYEEEFILDDMFNLDFKTVQRIRVSIIEKLNIIDKQRIDFGLPPEDIYDNVVERLMLNDMFGLQFKAVQTLKLSIVETLGINDIKKMGGDFPPADIIIKKLEQLRLLDKVKEILKEQHNIDSESNETFIINDINNISFKNVSIMRLSTLEQLSLIDNQNIEED